MERVVMDEVDGVLLDKSEAKDAPSGESAEGQLEVADFDEIQRQLERRQRRLVRLIAD